MSNRDSQDVRTPESLSNLQESRSGGSGLMDKTVYPPVHQIREYTVHGHGVRWPSGRRLQPTILIEESSETIAQSPCIINQIFVPF